jgi:hypothetical protein
MGDLRPMPRLRCPLVPLSLGFSLLRPFDTPQSTPPSSPPKSTFRSLTGQSRTRNGLVPIIIEQTVPRREQNAHTHCRTGSPRGPSGFSVNGCIFDRAICADHTSMIRLIPSDGRTADRLCDTYNVSLLARIAYAAPLLLRE